MLGSVVPTGHYSVILPNDKQCSACMHHRARSPHLTPGRYHVLGLYEDQLARLASSAISTMPWLSTPRILRGSRLATSTTC
jgi:hypothetical protein